MENILEILLPLIIIIAYIFPKVTGKKEEVSEEAPPKKPKFAVFNKLNEMFKQYYEADMEGRRQNSDEEDSYAWPPEAQQSEQPTYSQPQEPVESAKETLNQHETPSASVAASLQASATERQIDLDQRQKSLQTGNIMGSSTFLKKPGKRELRQAIIWSEILSPPKALRDE